MKNQAYSILFRNYRKMVESYNNVVNRIIKVKFEMDRFWKYKRDYPADWTRMAENLSAYRLEAKELKNAIIGTKMEMRECNKYQPEN